MGSWKWPGLTSMPMPHEDPASTAWVPFRGYTSLGCVNEGQKLPQVSFLRAAPDTLL